MVVLSFQSYQTMSIYIHDYNNSEPSSYGRIKMDEMGFDTEHPPIKIKLRPNDETVDIVSIGGKFISDIQLTPQQKAYIANIDVNKVPEEKWQDKVEKLDYELDECWAMTSKLRNYDVQFKHASDISKIVDPWIKILDNENIDSYDYYEESGEEESECDPDDPVWEPPQEGEDTDEYEYITPNTTINTTTDDLFKDTIEDNSDNDSDYCDTHENILEQLKKIVTDPKCSEFTIENVGDKVIGRSSLQVPPIEMFKAVMINPNLKHDDSYSYYRRNPILGQNLIVIENSNETCNYLVKTEIGKIKLIEMFKTDYEGVEQEIPESATKEHIMSVIIFKSTHCNGVDVDLYCDEGAYESGVNFYKRDDGTTGIIFCEEQNYGCYNYAMCLYESKIVPDLLLTNEAAANINNYSVPKTKEEENYWYDYEAQSYDKYDKIRCAKFYAEKRND